MIEFLRILFLGKVLLITPQPIDIDGTVVFDLREPIAAVTTGAVLEIDVTSMLAKRPDEAIPDFRRRLAEMFPSGAIEAALFGKDNVRVDMRYSGNHAYSGPNVTLLLAAQGGVPTGVEFTRLTITSQSMLKSVTVSWRNYKH